MSLPRFSIRGVDKLPIQSGYSPSFTKGFTITALNGGYPQTRATNYKQPVPVTATYQFGSTQECDAWYIWYNSVIKQGASKFIAKLDVGNGLQDYECRLVSPPSYSGFVGYYTQVTLEMVVNVNNNPQELEDYYLANYE